MPSLSLWTATTLTAAMVGVLVTRNTLVRVLARLHAQITRTPPTQASSASRSVIHSRSCAIPPTPHVEQTSRSRTSFPSKVTTRSPVSHCLLVPNMPRPCQGVAGLVFADLTAVSAYLPGPHHLPVDESILSRGIVVTQQDCPDPVLFGYLSEQEALELFDL